MATSNGDHEMEETEMTEDIIGNENCLTSKTALVNPSEEDFGILLDNLKHRIDQCQGETIYEIGCGEGSIPGLPENDMDSAIANLQRLSGLLGAEAKVLRERRCEGGVIKEFLVRKRAEGEDFMEVRVAVVGNVDAGKSTLLGVLTHSELDNGRGLARQKLFRHKHEMESGRTSSVSNDILGFDSNGRVVNKPEHGNLDWTKICTEASKVITFIDLAGHEKYLKTTVFGMTGHAPDFCMLMVGANMGVVGMTKEHLGLALALNIPVFVVITKIDKCPPNILAETLKVLQKVLKSQGCRKIPVLVQSEDDVVIAARNFTSEKLCPIFQVSNVTGERLDLLKMFMNLLAPRSTIEGTNCDMAAEFQIDDTFSVPGVGTVVSGTCLSGSIKLNDTLLLGPDLSGNFNSIVIRSIHRKRMPVQQVRAGQTASFALKKVKRSSIRKGMVLVSPLIQPVSYWEFAADVLVLHHPTTIAVGYQAMVHVGPVRQTATITSMSIENMRTGDKSICRFKFIKNSEFLRKDTKLVFREGRTKAIGTITDLFVPQDANSTVHQRTNKNLHNQHGQGGVKRRRGGKRKAASASATTANAQAE
ncbi:DgyrCDS11174 [Dimorphilus gyrociliatus]|uniref:DgyrCDS11174 n=1 Tax=Dimorphilus gyrociliatus TaxID=2664684 RepID=A0A7I8W2H0_9ANNE|nr:DgyrCDS11174 [Dimorphilus gyrociliatus]